MISKDLSKPIDDGFVTLLGEHVRANAALLCLRCRATGEVVEANRFAGQVLGEPLIGRRLQDLFVDFQNTPDLHTLLDSEGPRMISVSTAMSVPQTFYFTFCALHDDIVVIGETNQYEVERLRR